MNMIVCCKQIFDPEAPPASFKIDAANNKVIPPTNVPLVISPFDANAVEAALKIKDAQGGKITVISMGNNLDVKVAKSPLSMGGDDLVLLDDKAFENGDSWSTALVLSAAIKKIGEYDLILCGRQAADWDAGQVGSGIAQILGIPIISLAKKIEAADGKIKVERVLADGYQVVEAALPALVTVSNEIGEPRIAKLQGIMAAGKKQPIIWKPADLGLEESQLGPNARKTVLLKLFQPVRESKCEMVEGESAAEAGEKLADKLREAKLV
jgi:electron transfer flavoprotein beta subunit